MRAIRSLTCGEPASISISISIASSAWQPPLRVQPTANRCQQKWRRQRWRRCGGRRLHVHAFFCVFQQQHPFRVWHFSEVTAAAWC